MHEIGWIKWFDEEKGFGLIEWPGHSDIRVYREQVWPNPDKLENGVAVSFDVPKDVGGGPAAMGVRLLREESCTDTLVRALGHGDDSLFNAAFDRVIQLQPKPKQAKKIAKVLGQRIDAANLLRLGGRVAAIRSLPHVILKEGETIRKHLPPAEHLAFCLTYLQPGSSKELLPEIIVLARNTPSSELEFWSNLPVAYYQHDSAIRSQLPTSVRTRYLVNAIRQEKNKYEVAAAKSELLTCLGACEERSIWDLLDPELRYSAEFWAITPRSARLDAVSTEALRPDHVERCPDILEFLMRELSTLSDESRQTWERLPRFLKDRPDLSHRKELESLLVLTASCLCDQGYEQRTSWQASGVYVQIEEEDRRLAQEWMPQNSLNHDSDMARLLSARCAEKVALRFYESLGHTVDDVSRTQLPNDTDDWRYFDLLVDKSKTVDVKNARPPLHRRDRYTKHTVRRLKETRTGDVTIAGVLSPYVKLDRMENARNDCNMGHIIFLGETDRTTINKLEQQFSRVGNLIIESEVFNVVPPWGFEYPSEFYRSRNTIRRELQQLAYSGTASLSELRELGCNPLPAFLLAGITLPSSWENDLLRWESAFYRMLLPGEDKTITMPFLFLGLLSHFLKMASQCPAAQDYEPSRYRSFLYAPGDSRYKRPLGIFDPLDIISALISTLQILWGNRRSIRFQDFECFSFKGLGLLRGTRRCSGDKVTILAYCGGSVQEMGPCGYSPLVIGRHPTCENTRCRRLVCPDCGYCDAPERCPLSQNRSMPRAD
jgi:cold shock CspA family protein